MRAKTKNTWPTKSTTFATFVVKELSGLYLLRTRLPFAQEHFDFFQERREQIFFLQTGSHIFAAIDRAITSDNNHRNVRAFFMDSTSQFHAVHAFHAKISHQNIEIFFVELP